MTKLTIFFAAFILIALYSFVTDNTDISNSKTQDNMLQQIEKEEEQDQTDGIFLITNQSSTKSGASVVLRVFNQHTRVIRFREVVLNDKIKSLSIMNEKSLTLNLFEDAYYTAAIQNVYTNIDGTITVTAMIDKYEQGYLIITSFQNRSLVNIYIPEISKYYQIISDPNTNMHFLLEIHPSDRDYIQHGPTLVPELLNERYLPELGRIKLESETNSKGPNDPANIDVMIIYTPAAKNWADNNGGGIQNVVAQAISEAQIVLSNSLTIITNTLVHSAQVSYTESGNSYTDLARLASTNDGHMDEIHAWRDNYAADIVVLFTYTEDVGGLGYLLDDVNGYPSWAFSICRVQQVANTTYTLIHEMGHNMGCDHHKQQLVSPGPTNWINWPANTWSAGWRWTGTNNGKYCSVMTYENGMYFLDNVTHTRVPYFSNPSVSYQGVATGHSADGDNARTLREIKHVVEAYRPLVQPPDEFDFGDAPDGPYPTLIANNGAYHYINTTIFLGSLIDNEPDGQPTLLADGDDLNTLADEDGVTFMSLIFPGQNSIVQFNINGNGFINAWFDWNSNGSWIDPGDHTMVDVPANTGIMNCQIPVPLNSVSGLTYARFRFSSFQGLNYDGFAPDGEVEDYAIYIGEVMDFGDAPEGALAYPATGVIGQFPNCMNVGPPGSWIEHTSGTVFLGSTWDGEVDGNAGLCVNPWLYNADECQNDMTGDASLIYPSSYTITGYPGAQTVTLCPLQGIYHVGLILGYPCQSAIWGTDLDLILRSQLATTTYVNVLFDWNQDGIWSGNSDCQGINAPEHVLVNFQVPPNYNGNLQLLTPSAFTIGPNSGYVWARFTITDQPVPLPWDGSGIFTVGETEDYLLRIAEAPHEGNLDFGDAPGPMFSTLLADYGACHLIDGITYSGVLVDAEPDGQPNPDALGDNNNGLSDEDGVTFTTLLIPGKQASIKVNASTNCKLNVWIDFDRDGQWVTPGEQVFINQTLNQGLNTIDFNVPAWSGLGRSYARFRVNQAGGLDYYGYGGAGEVEDYLVFIVNPGDSSKMHWPQLPGSGGCAFEFSNSRLADDFLCVQSGPINYIRFWISHQMNNITPTGDFTIEIWSDVPAQGFSLNKPGNILWSRTFQPGEYSEAPMPDDLQCWFTNPPNWVYQPNDHDKWTQITIDNIPDPFIQTRGEIYWLVIKFNSNWQYKGWKTAPWNPVQQHFNWKEILWYDPSTQDWVSWSGDLAFVINNVIPQNLLNQNITVQGGQNRCFAATQTLTTAGGGSTFITHSGATVYLIAGQNVIMLPVTHFHSGSYVHAYIDQTGEYCTNPKVMLAPVAEEVQPDVTPIKSSENDMFFKVYPNPTTGLFTLELTEVDEYGSIQVEIFNILGERILAADLPESSQYIFDLSAKLTGLYLVRILKGHNTGIVKLIKQ